MPDIAVLRGDVVRVRLDPTEGSESRGQSRPCIVVQNDIGNQHSPTTIIVPLTDAKDRETYPFQVLVQKGDGGLTKNSIALGEQIRVIDRKRITSKMGSLSTDTMDKIDEALHDSLQLI